MKREEITERLAAIPGVEHECLGTSDLFKSSDGNEVVVYGSGSICLMKHERVTLDTAVRVLSPDALNDEPITDEWLAGLTLTDCNIGVIHYKYIDCWCITIPPPLSSPRSEEAEFAIPAPTGKRALLALLAGLGIEQTKGGA